MRSRKLLAVLAALVIPLAIPAPAQAIGPALLPVTVTNSTGRGDAVYLYVIGINLATGRLGYVNAAGTFTPWTGGQLPPSPAPDVAIAGPGNGGSTTIRFPRGFSGRALLLLRREAQVLPHPGRPGPARAMGVRRRQLQHPVRLERVHLQRRRPVAQQLPGRHVRRPARGHRDRRQRAPPSAPATWSPTAATTSSTRSGRRRAGRTRSTPAPTARCCGCSRRARPPAPGCSARPTWTATSPRRGTPTRPRR